MYPLVQLMLYTVLLMTAGGPSVGQPCTGWGEAVSMVTCLAGVVVLALTVSVVETKLSLSEKASMALRCKGRLAGWLASCLAACHTSYLACLRACICAARVEKPVAGAD